MRLLRRRRPLDGPLDESAPSPAASPAPSPHRRTSGPGLVTAYAATLAAIGTTTLVALLASGAARPSPLPVLVFALLLALTIARAVLYPSEFAITAESALLLGAVVVFRDDAPLVGPLALALLAGLLDRVHWEQRAFVRMAYNGGSRGVAILGAAVAYGTTTGVLGDSVAALVLAVGTAAVVVTTLDTLLAVGLDCCRGRGPTSSWHELLEIDALNLPVAVVGGAAGLIAIDVGWWAAIPLFVALALAPQLAAAQAVASTRVLRDALLAIEVVVVLAVVALWAPVPGFATVCVLSAIALVVGVELVVDARVPVPPALGIVVVAASVAVGERAGVFAGGLVAGLATAVAWWSTRRRRTGSVLLAIAVATVLGLSAALVATADVAGREAAIAAGMGGVVLFGVAAAIGARGRQRWEVAVLVWSAPIAVLGVVVRWPVDRAHVVDLGLSCVVLTVAVVLAAWCGSTPWRSRFVSRALGVVRGRGRRRVFIGLCAVAIVFSVATVVLGRPYAEWLAWVALVAGESATAMALFAARQWHLAPTARAWRASVLLGASLALPLVLVAGLRDGRGWTAGAVAVLVATVVTLGRTSVARSDDAAAAIGATT